MTPEQITPNLQAIQDSISGFDFTSLSTQGQQEAYVILKNLYGIICTDSFTIANAPSVIDSIKTAQTAQKTSVVTPQ